MGMYPVKITDAAPTKHRHSTSHKEHAHQLIGFHTTMAPALAAVSAWCFGVSSAYSSPLLRSIKHQMTRRRDRLFPTANDTMIPASPLQCVASFRIDRTRVSSSAFLYRCPTPPSDGSASPQQIPAHTTWFTSFTDAARPT